MMFALYHRFRRERRGAIMLIFALSLVPLMLLVGFSIDYSFFAQARAQFSLAGDSAASYAIRVATATYALDSQANETVAVATQNAEIAGNAAGDQWFSSQIATLPRAYVSGGTPFTSVTPVSGASSTPTGFTASVQYQGTYPPFFDLIWSSPSHLKNSGYTWYVTGTAQAQSSYTYSEILVLMDTSGSMLIGANQSDITEMDDSTVCIPSSDMSWTAAGGDVEPRSGYYYPSGDGPIYGGYYGDDTNSYIPDWSQVTGYNPAPSNASQNQTGTCKSNYGGPNALTMSPCAFACHTTTNTFTIANDTAAGTNGYYQGAGTYPADFYGYARSLRPKVTLRIDSVFAAAETVIKAMQQSEQVSGQYAVGVYTFNDHIAPMAPTPASIGGTAPAEATTDLATALLNVQNNDYTNVNYNSTPALVSVPKVADDSTGASGAYGCSLSTECEAYDFTNFPLAMQEWSPNSTTVSPTPVTKLTASGDGSSITSPLKSIIIITDGLEDSTPGANTAVNRRMGEMTGYKAEAADTELLNGTNNAICQPLKDLGITSTEGYTIYVLYINYYPAPIETYYLPYYATSSTPYVAQDYPISQGGNLQHVYAGTTGGAIQNWVAGVNTQNDFESGTSLVLSANRQNNAAAETDPDPASVPPAPDTRAMEACGGPPQETAAQHGTLDGSSTYFFSATNSNDINNAMVNILQSALNTTTRITN